MCEGGVVRGFHSLRQPCHPEDPHFSLLNHWNCQFDLKWEILTYPSAIYEVIVIRLL